MKRNLLKTFVAIMLAPGLVYAGGLVTNTNQSASFVRNPAQNAVIGAEGTYFNPAGLVWLEDGFHFSISNQTITQTREISSNFPNMNRSNFEGAVSAPLFPSVYGVFKQGRIAYSLGINPIGGGGSANFEQGLPSFEQQVAILPGALTDARIPTSRYSLNSSFDGRSLNWGVQVNASYALNDMISLSLGLRFITATNTYQGHLSDIMINPNRPQLMEQYNGINMVSAPEFFSTIAAALSGPASGAASLSTMLTPAVSTQGTLPIENVVQDPALLTQLRSIITAAGQNPDGMNVATAVAVLNGFVANAATMTLLATQTRDRQVDAKQTGWGIAPVLSAHFRFSDDLNLSLKYEHRASITMTNETTIDDVGLYPDGQETPNDMPAMLALGVSYRLIDRITLSAGGHYYFDKNANYGRKIAGEFVPNDQVIDNNFWEAAFGIDFVVNEALTVSTGYLRTQTGVNQFYQSDLSHSLNTNSIAVGGRYRLNNNTALNFGIMNIFYEETQRDFSTHIEKYNRSALSIGLGIDFRL